MHYPISTEFARLEQHAPTSTFLEDVLAGLSRPQKAIPSKYFYDETGSKLFEEITQLPEYYLTRTEIGIMERFIDEMMERIGPRSLLVEYGSGSSLKTRIILDHLREPAGYVPIDISRDHLLESSSQLAKSYPLLNIIPISADYTTQIRLPDIRDAHPVVFFPGSTIGNFTPTEAEAFLARLAAIVGSGGGLLLGADLRKDSTVIEAAYNDSQGVTAAFNKNVLRRINRELDGTFNLDKFSHRAYFNATHSRIEMHLLSSENQCVRIGSMPFPFAAGESILTEYSYKYTQADIEGLADKAGFDVVDVWTDDLAYFSVQYLKAR